MLSTTTTVALADAGAALAALLAHFAEHHVTVTHRDTESATIAAGLAEARMHAEATSLGVVVQAPHLAGLIEMKRLIAGHLLEAAPGALRDGPHWSGDGTGPALPPDFRVMTVTAREPVSPHMHRIWLRGEALGRFDRLDALHVRLFFPPAGLREPVWPMIGANGLPEAIAPHLKPAVRKYTIRHIDVANGSVAIDFVLHGDAGPGSRFARHAAVGDRIGMAGPGGRGLVEAQRYVFMTDPTGLPALARMLAHLPPDARGEAVVEVAGADDEIMLGRPPGIALRWLHRTAGARLEDAFAALALPDEPIYLWVAAEHAAFRHIRAAARQRLRESDRQLIVSYWRQGASEDEHAASKRREMQRAADVEPQDR